MQGYLVGAPRPNVLSRPLQVDSERLHKPFKMIKMRLFIAALLVSLAFVRAGKITYSGFPYFCVRKKIFSPDPPALGRKLSFLSAEAEDEVTSKLREMVQVQQHGVVI